MVKYYISVSKNGRIDYGKTNFDGVVSSSFSVYETHNNEVDWKKQLMHYQAMYPQDILSEDPEFPLVKDEDMFPFTDRHIRLYLTHAQLTDIVESPYKGIIDYALLCPYQKDEKGLTVWLERLNNPQMSSMQVKELLEDTFGVNITFRDPDGIAELLTDPTILGQIGQGLYDGYVYIVDGIFYFWNGITGNWWK